MTQDLTALLAVLSQIKDGIHAIAEKMSASVPDDEAPTEPPAPVIDYGYTGPVLGTYRVKGDPKSAITTILDSDGGYSTIIQRSMSDWLIAHLAAWDVFVSNGVFAYSDGFWYLNKMKLIPGQLVKIARVGGKTTANPLGMGQIIAANNAGDPSLCVTKLDNVSPEKTPWLFHKIYGFADRLYFLIQPQTKPGHVANAWWVPMELLEKVA